MKNSFCKSAQNADNCVYTRETDDCCQWWKSTEGCEGNAHSKIQDDGLGKIEKPSLIRVKTVLTCHKRDMWRKYLKGLTCKTVNLEPHLMNKNWIDDAKIMNNVRKYREAVWSLIYLTTCTRSDLSFVVGKLSQYFTESHRREMDYCKTCTEISESHGWMGKELRYGKCDTDSQWEAL